MTVIAAWLLADFISGLVHWWEDRAILGASRFKFINEVRKDNEYHHQHPLGFLRYSWWGNISTTAPIAWISSTVLFFTGAPLLFVWTSFFLGFGNLVHRWAHESKFTKPRIVTALQRTGFFISPSHHSGHHFKGGHFVTREESKVRYCVMSSWLNPVLDKIRFFDFLGWVFNV
jgi:hypothetical protein